MPGDNERAILQFSRNGVRFVDGNKKRAGPIAVPPVHCYCPRCYREADSVVTFLAGSAFCGFFTYLSSHAAQRAHRSSSVSRDAGPWSSSGYM